jgi:hypothetical protein
MMRKFLAEELSVHSSSTLLFELYCVTPRFSFKSQIAREHGIRFLETSAKDNVNIEVAFREIANAILTKTIAQEQANGAGAGGAHGAGDRVNVGGGRAGNSTSSQSRCC